MSNIVLSFCLFGLLGKWCRVGFKYNSTLLDQLSKKIRQEEDLVVQPAIIMNLRATHMRLSVHVNSDY